MSSIIPIVNEKDKIIGYKDRNDRNFEHIYRVSALWITNSKGEILLARRALTKSHDPGKWGPAVAGTVEKGETYTANIIKEAYEEIGLKNIKPKKSKKIRRTGEHNYFTQWFFLKLDKDISYFKIDKREVDSIKWFSKQELKKTIKNNPSEFLSGISECIKEFSK